MVVPDIPLDLALLETEAKSVEHVVRGGPWVCGMVRALPRYAPFGHRCGLSARAGIGVPSVAGCTVTGVPAVHVPEGSRSTVADSSWPGINGSRTGAPSMPPSK